MGEALRSSLGVVGVGQLGGNEVAVVGGQHQVVDVASMIAEPPSAEVQSAGDPLDHVKDTEQPWAWMQARYAPTANAKTQ